MAAILPFPPVDPPMLPAWSCHCGKRSVLDRCWNCGNPRPAGKVDGGTVDGKADGCYNDDASGVQGTGGNSIAKSGKGVWKRLETASCYSAHFLGRSVDTPFQGLPTGASASGPQIGPRNGPMAFKGVLG